MERSRLSAPVVIFDLGEVLASPPNLFQALAKATAADLGDLKDAYWRFRDAHDRGASATDFWTQVLTALGSRPEPRLIDELTHLDAKAWTSIRTDAAALLRDLNDRGVRLVILSNAPSELARVARESDWAPYISDWFFSGELGTAKPDRAIFDTVTRTLDIPAATLLFFDDRQVNVDGASAAGWDARLWESGDQARAVIAQRGLLG